jgi:branched-chain amino acid transport system substrate-binding protein
MKLFRFILSTLLFILPGVSVAGKNTIDIAAIYALTGIAAEANSYTLRGVMYAVDELNQSGGILENAIRLQVFDNQSTPIGSTLAARQAIAANVVAIVGPDWSSHSLAVARVAQENGIPMISSLSTNPEVTRIGNYIFRVCFTDDFQGRVLARFAHQDLNASTAVILVDVTSDYSLKLSEIFRKNFEDVGGRVLQEVEYKHSQPRFDEEITAAVKAKADAMFIPGHDESGLIVKQAQERGTTSVFLGADGWSTAVFFIKGGVDLKHGYFSTHWAVDVESEKSKSFVKKYNIAAESAEDNIALGYDAMMLLGDAIARAGAIDRQKIRDAVARTKSYQAVTGPISFNENGDPIKSVVIMEIINGRPKYLKTVEP